MILNTDYERQIYVGLSTDDWGDVSINEGAVVYLMDQSKCFMFDGSTMHELPDLGGGGGGGDAIVFKSVAVTAINDTTSNLSMFFSFGTAEDVIASYSLRLTSSLTTSATLKLCIIDGYLYLNHSYSSVYPDRRVRNVAINGVAIPDTDVVMTAPYVQASNTSTQYVAYKVPVATPDAITTFTFQYI